MTQRTFDLSGFLDRFDTGNVYNAEDMILILRADDSPTQHILADLLEAQQDIIKELTLKLHNATHRRKPRQRKA